MLLLLAGFAFFNVKRKESVVDGVLRPYLLFAIISSVVYLVSYLFVFTGRGTLLDWLGLQGSMLNYHLTMKETHPDSLNPLFWWVGQHLYYVDYASEAEIWAKSNPFTWLTAAAAAFYLGFEWLRSRRLCHLLPTLAFATQYFVWFLSPRIVFIFYMVPIVPFLHLSLGYCLSRAGAGGKLWKVLVAIYLAAAVLLFAFDYPRLTGLAHS
jgi:predicted membrane-bound dolichyl-phosphate-mannose-protein mannosyltransferase